ncbi:MAG: trypsin-like serine protease [Chloroflexi bacterium]|nr:MAG: trypsin-like serine protease [Chloroflexota bacterium]
MTESDPPSNPDPQPAESRSDPVEVQHFGPPPTQPTSSTWRATPAWPSQPPASSRGESHGLGFVPVLTIALVTAIVSGSLSAAAVANLLQRPSASSLPTGSNVSDVHIDESSAVITAVNKVMPAVVTITSRSSGGVLGGANGVGSGLIFDSGGWILTNKHVVQGADQIEVTLNDTRVFPATIYGIDTLTDLAIIKVDATNLPAAPIGSSDKLEVGQLAIAIGNPLGTFENTVTTGVVSGLGRQIQAGDTAQTSSEQLNNLIQTDAAINPGNSGGPLVNSAGQVIGINTAVNQEAQGIGFAIPIDVARPIMSLALAGKPIARPWIGVYYQVVTAQLASEQHLAADYGVLIEPASNGAAGIFPDSPAAKAGLKEGDQIVAVDGEKVDETHDLGTLVLPHLPGDQIVLHVLRGGSSLDLKVTLGTLPKNP